MCPMIELINSIHIEDILGLENLEKELSKYITDFSKKNGCCMEV